MKSSTVKLPTDVAGLIKTVGKACFGRRWKVPLAGELGVASKTLYRWMADDSKLPTKDLEEKLLRVVERVGDVLTKDAARMETIAAALRERAAGK
jgi:hypothetical protein